VNNALVVGVVEAKRPFGLLIQIRKVTDLDGVAEQGLLSISSVSSWGGAGGGGGGGGGGGVGGVCWCCGGGG
jgi:hypothetical protein